MQLINKHKPNIQSSMKPQSSQKQISKNQAPKQIKYIQKFNHDSHQSIQVNPFLNTIIYRCMFLKNGLPITYKSKVTEIARILSDINSRYKAISVCIDPESKLIYFKCSSLFKSKRFKQISNQADAYLQSIHQFVKKEIKQISLRIQLILGQITPHQYCLTLKLPEDNYIMNKFKKQSQLIQQLNQLVSISHKHFKFMDNESTKAQPIISKENESAFKNYHDNNEVYQNSDDDEDKKISQKQQDYKKLLMHCKIIKNKQNEKINIYSQIKILKIQQVKWYPYSEGEFVTKQRANIKYHYVENKSDDYISKFMVKKSNKLINKSLKVEEEKQIIDLFKNYASLNIIKCYYTDQTHNNINLDLLIDYYTFKSLADYVKKTEKCLSLTIKILLICQLIQGMRFLRDFGIVHNELKAQNLLVGKSLFLKITEFGQSVRLGSSKNNKSGYSIPFVAPQRFHKNQLITPKMDTFSIGVLIYQLIFQQFPFIIRDMNEDKLIKEYESNQSINRIFINQEKLNYHQGPIQILNIIYTISLKCLHPNLKIRPHLDWIQIIMRRIFDCL